FTQYGTGFFDEFQVYAGAGYVVLFSNPRGGSGYSEEWGRAIRGPVGGAGPGWGTVDYEDVMAVVDTALERFDFVDPDRLGVLVLHSERDLRCNIEQGEHLFTLLRLLGKEVEMLRFPAESHELSRSGSPLHRVQRFEAILDWFERYLSPGT